MSKFIYSQSNKPVPENINQSLNNKSLQNEIINYKPNPNNVSTLAGRYLVVLKKQPMHPYLFNTVRHGHNPCIN